MICVGKVRLVQGAILWILLLLKTNVQHECSQNGGRAMDRIKKQAFIHSAKPYIPGFALILFLLIRPWVVGFLDKQRSLTYEPQWFVIKWGFVFVTEIAFGFILCLLATPCEGRLHRFSFGFLLLFVGLVGLTSAFYWGMFYPVLAPESGTITLLHVLSGVALFNVFFRKRGIPLEDGSISKV